MPGAVSREQRSKPQSKGSSSAGAVLASTSQQSTQGHREAAGEAVRAIAKLLDCGPHHVGSYPHCTTHWMTLGTILNLTMLRVFICKMAVIIVSTLQDYNKDQVSNICTTLTAMFAPSKHFKFSLS